MREFEYAFAEESELHVEEDENGDLYVERGTATRIAWMLFGVFVAAIAGWFLLRYDGSEGWLLSVGTPSAIAVLALAGVVAEAVAGTERSAVVQEEGGYYLEMLSATRWYVGAASVAVLATGVSLFLDVRSGGATDSAGRGRGLAALADGIPFGEFVVLLVTFLVSLLIVQKARDGRMAIHPKQGQ